MSKQREAAQAGRGTAAAGLQAPVTDRLRLLRVVAGVQQ